VQNKSKSISKPGVNFTNVLRVALAHADPKSLKKYSKVITIFGGRWGSIENLLDPKTKPPLGNLACPNP